MESLFHQLSTAVQELWDALVKKPTPNSSRSSRILEQTVSADIPPATDLLPTSTSRSSALPEVAEPAAYYSGAAPLLLATESDVQRAESNERLKRLGPVSGFAPIHVDKIETKKEEKSETKFVSNGHKHN
jgi:hypothetical protein